MPLIPLLMCHALFLVLTQSHSVLASKGPALFYFGEDLVSLCIPDHNPRHYSTKWKSFPKMENRLSVKVDTNVSRFKTEQNSLLHFTCVYLGATSLLFSHTHECVSLHWFV